VSEFYSVITAINAIYEDSKMKKKKVKPGSKRNMVRICDALINFRRRYTIYHDAVKEGEIPEGTEPLFETYRDTITKEIHIKEIRMRRHAILSRVIEPVLQELDTDRLFSKDQKDLIWNSDPTHTCRLCDKEVVKFDDYEPDHIKAHSKGWPTCISNGQITHMSCNRRKKDHSANEPGKIYKNLLEFSTTDFNIREDGEDDDE
jgi:hypothetical protein